LVFARFPSDALIRNHDILRHATRNRRKNHNHKRPGRDETKSKTKTTLVRAGKSDKRHTFSPALNSGAAALAPAATPWCASCAPVELPSPGPQRSLAPPSATSALIVISSVSPDTLAGCDRRGCESGRSVVPVQVLAAGARARARGEAAWPPWCSFPPSPLAPPHLHHSTPSTPTPLPDQKIKMTRK
jgi:hypothetical protein